MREKIATETANTYIIFFFFFLSNIPYENVPIIILNI